MYRLGDRSGGLGWAASGRTVIMNSGLQVGVVRSQSSLLFLGDTSPIAPLSQVVKWLSKEGKEQAAASWGQQSIGLQITSSKEAKGVDGVGRPVGLWICGLG